VPSTTKMDHVALVHIGLERTQPAPGAPDNRRADLISWMVRDASSSRPGPRRNCDAKRRSLTVRRAI
jgi:hypothetical protein